MNIDNHISHLWQFDPLAKVMIALITVVTAIVWKFSTRYLRGDQQYRPFFFKLALLYIALVAFVSANSTLILLAAWALCHGLLVSLMTHKKEWRAAAAAGSLAAKNFCFGFACLLTSFIGMFIITHQTSIQQITHSSTQSPYMAIPLILLTLGALSQSGIWPFHRWLLSSLNSPTPVSALMHAGLINGGGFILIRFSALYTTTPMLTHTLFIVGLISAVMAGLWKLIQTDIKRMLACSTVSQIGFMIAQCGLGLYAAALAHLCWHSLFKAYQFLGIGNSIHERRFDLSAPITLSRLIPSLCFGIAGSACFALVLGLHQFPNNTRLFTLIIAFIASTQIALTHLSHDGKSRVISALVVACLAGLVYGASIRLIETLVAPMQLQQALPLNALHIIGMIVLLVAWFAFIFKKSALEGTRNQDWVSWGYVKALNASQPDANTVTTHRNAYRY